jgi:hypothetical protein
MQVKDGLSGSGVRVRHYTIPRLLDPLATRDLGGHLEQPAEQQRIN